MVEGRFISFEGSEGCGKSTQVGLLAARLEAAGERVIKVREPGGTVFGEKVRYLLKYDPEVRTMAPETELLLLTASRAELVRTVIRPALEAGAWVLSDRFYHSTLAYQGYGRGLPLEMIHHLVDLAVGTTRPHRTFVLRTERSAARERMRFRAERAPGSDRFEAEHDAFFDRVEHGFEELIRAEPARLVAIDAGATPEIVSESIWNALSAIERNGTLPS